MKLDHLRNKTLGYDNSLNKSYGNSFINYEDHTVSTKWLRFLENHYSKLSEIYKSIQLNGNSAGEYLTQLYDEAKAKIRKCVGANEKYCIIPTGTGAIEVIEKFTKIMGLFKTTEYFKERDDFSEKIQFNKGEKKTIKSCGKKFNQKKTVVFISSNEYHSIETQWREGDAEVVKIGLDHNGLFDLEALEKQISNPKYRNLMKIGAFSGTLDITGVKMPVYEIAKIVHKHGGYVFFDYSVSGPYVEINMTKDYESYFDGIYLSMNKFIGGTGSSGVLILNKALYSTNNKPYSSEGVVVKQITNEEQKYLLDYEKCDDVGISDIMHVIRASMILELKDKIGVHTIEKIESDYIKRVFNELGKIDNIDILGNLNPDKRISIISFNIKYKNSYLHHGFVSTLLRGLFGIKSKTGWVCDELSSIKLLNIENKKVEGYRDVIDGRIVSMKQGWTQLNFHYTLDKPTFDYIISAVKFVATHGHEFLEEYKVGSDKVTWGHKAMHSLDKEELSVLDAFLLYRKKPKTENNSNEVNNKFPEYAFKQYYR